MNVSVIGTGYVGLVTGACFAEMGNNVICVDIDEKKIKNLKKGQIPIFEPGLDKMVHKNYKNHTLDFTTEIEFALSKTNICFVAVGTPMGEDGSADLGYVIDVAKSIGENMLHHMYIINKSTVPVGTADEVKEVIQKVLDKRSSKLTFNIISNPEFLKEGDAISDFMKPDRVIVGIDNDSAFEVMSELYAPFTHSHDRLVKMDIRSAEMTKYAANAMLATKISFMNEIANICERVGADANQVRHGIGSDSRIGYSFIYPGCGYGGSCFPKDVQALIKTSLDVGYEPKILDAVETVNLSQKKILSEKVIKRFSKNLQGKVFAVWGLAFKPGTDDMREASSIIIINELTKRGARIKAYDPKAMSEAKNFYLKDNDNIEYVDSKYDALFDAEALILVTEWKEFRSPDFDEMRKRLNNAIIFDGRNQYNWKKLIEENWEYYGIGV